MIKGIIFDWRGTLADRNHHPFPFTKKVLERLKVKYRLGLISAAGKNNVSQRKKILDSSDLLPLFDSVIVTENKNEIHFLQCMQELNIIPQNTAIVDDRTIRGIKIGNKHGCQTYWIKKGFFENELPNAETGQPTQIIDTIEDLLKYL